MFATDDAEELLERIRRMEDHHLAEVRRMEGREQSLAGALGDSYAALDDIIGLEPKFDWEGSQSEHYANGVEAAMMVRLKSYRDRVVVVRDRIKAVLQLLGIDPRQVGSTANERRRIDSMRREALALRKRADEIEASVGCLFANDTKNTR